VAVDLRLRISHPCPYCDISGKFPRSLFLLWCDNRRDVFLLSSPEPDELRRVLSAFRDSFHARPLLVDGRNALISVPDFEWADPPSVTGLARKHGVWVIHPVLYFESKETYRLLAPGKEALNRLVTRLRRLGEVEILSVSEKGRLDGIRDEANSAIHLLQGLTDRQAASLVSAYEAGLFDVPARASWDAVARRDGLSRSTFGEHLRKGQLRLLANSYAALKVRVSAQGEPVVLSATGGPERSVRAPLRGTREPP
jgi:predicted DNA binding protein